MKSDDRDWIVALPVEELLEKRKHVVRHDGRQIAVFATDDGFFACNNRCPHQGYPLVEGSVDRDCLLTCNWHNWKFDLHDGRNLYGGDRLRTYPVAVREGKLHLDVTEEPFTDRYATALSNLRSAVHDNSYDRIARELGRVQAMGGSLTEAVRRSILWSYQHLEYGWTHAYAGVADWLALSDEHVGDSELQLICHLESVGHIADDIRLRPTFPYTEDSSPYTLDEFLKAVEDQQEPQALSLLNGALEGGLHFADLELDLATAALLHYNDFGHTLIYLSKISGLIKRLGVEVEKPLLQSYVRGLIYTTREDLIPEFRGYATALSHWQNGNSKSDVELFDEIVDSGINGALEATVSASRQSPERLFDTLLAVNSSHMLHFDLSYQNHVDKQIADNSSWLSFTHSITFANAVRALCTKYPELWPKGLLQMACFAGRNHRYVQQNQGTKQWLVDDSKEFYAESLYGLFDHGCEEFIVSVHLLKTLLAAETESQIASESTQRLLTAAMNRFLHSPLKRKHVRRTARQAMRFVADGD